ncbi:DMT family transporter [Streptomyces sp. NBC_01190]|uniref:DMT family transporter n=1 Tax=Streptomyces sp. NBC_01190 TaxID=2903767 RepID=UPI00386DC794|nr:DMT family transporter [Streptomyces sp. NBC_01190]
MAAENPQSGTGTAQTPPAPIHPVGAAAAPAVSPAGGQRTRTVSICAVVGAALLWSSSFAVTKEVLSDVQPLTIGALRFTLAALVLLVLVRLAARRRPVERPTGRQRYLIWFSGFLGITVYFILENFGVKMSTASDASIMAASYPLMTMLLELVLFRARMPVTRVVAVLLAAAGAYLVVDNGATVGGSRRWSGDILLLLGGLVWAFYNVVCKLVGGRDALSLTYQQMIVGAGGFLLASLLEATRWSMPSVTSAALLVYLAVGCSVGGFLLYNYGLQTLKPSVAVNILNLVPAFGVLGAVLINGESVQLAQALGGIVIVGGVMLGLVDRRH